MDLFQYFIFSSSSIYFALGLTYNEKKKTQTAKKIPIACTLKSIRYIALVLQSDPLGQTQL